MDSSATIVGNLTRDPELRFTPSGQPTCSFGVAVNRVWTDRQTNERKESTSFFDVVCWGELAEHVATSLQKGARVVVVGRLDQRSWETQENEKRSKVEITAEEVSPSLRWATCTVTRASRDQQGGGQPPVAPAPGPAAYAPPASEPVMAPAPIADASSW